MLRQSNSGIPFLINLCPVYESWTCWWIYKLPQCSFCYHGYYPWGIMGCFGKQLLPATPELFCSRAEGSKIWSQWDPWLWSSACWPPEKARQEMKVNSRSSLNDVSQTHQQLYPSSNPQIRSGEECAMPPAQGWKQKGRQRWDLSPTGSHRCD